MSMKDQEFKVGDRLRYNDGRPGHTDARCTVVSVDPFGMVVQFDGRADSTTIQFTDRAWMDHLSVIVGE